MEALKQGQIRVHKKGGESYVAPELNKDNIVRLLGHQIARIEHYKPIVAELITPKPKTSKKKTKKKK